MFPRSAVTRGLGILVAVVLAGCGGSGLPSMPATTAGPAVPTPAATSAASAAPRATPSTTSWIVEDLGEPGGLVDVVAGGPGLVAVGYSSWEEPTRSTAWTSVDGVEWRPVPGPGGFELGRMTAVADGPAGLVAVGRPCGEGFCVGVSFWISRDGVSWAAVHDPPGVGARDLTSVVAWDGRYFAGGAINGGWAGVLWSTDGIAWRQAWADPAPPDQGGLLAGSSVTALAAFAGGLAAAVFDGAHASFRLSGDGDEWRTVDPPEPGAFVAGLAPWGAGLLAAGQDASAHGAIWLSTDGTTWERVADLGPGAAADVAVGAGRALVAAHVADGVAQVLETTDGRSWAPMATPPGVAAWTLPLAIAAFGGGFVAVGSSGGGTVDASRLAVWRTEDLATP